MQILISESEGWDHPESRDLLRIHLLWGGIFVGSRRVDGMVMVAVVVVLVVVITLDMSLDIVCYFLNFLDDVGHVGGRRMVNSCGCLEGVVRLMIVVC